ncbi:hypothetical protein ACFVGX_23340 [Streptomyces sp. NPDC127113]|uniref:hypothetical protein n=1 Tax=Streptomyces sp. NPDC127113 TaxID=3345365 RepID=UPI00363997D3
MKDPAQGPLDALRARTGPEDCIGGPTLPGAQITADADLVVDGLLLDFTGANAARWRRCPSARRDS